MKYRDYLLPLLALVSGWTFCAVIIAILDPKYRAATNALQYWLGGLVGIAGLSVIYGLPTLVLFIRKRLKR